MDPSSASSSKENLYLTTWNVYLKNSTYTKTMTDFVEEVASYVTTKITKDGLRSSPVFRVLGVGSGKGKTDLRILAGTAKAFGATQTKKAALHSAVVEPSAEMIEEFKTSVSPLPHSLAGVAEVSFEWHEMTFQKFCECFPQKESFDMIHFVASLFYLDAESALRCCHQKLTSGGAMFCTVTPEHSFFPKMSRKLHTKLDLGSAQKIYSDVDLVNIARKINWKYEELWKAKYLCDITCCFDESSQEGSILLDFLTHQRDFRTRADQAIYNEVMDFLNEESITDDIGRKLIEPEISAIVIYKEQ